MHVHILGAGGTFMAGIAVLAKALGHRVTGSDQALYPPMSTQLERAGIDVLEGWDPAQLEPAPDLVVIGNALSRGNAVIEEVLDRRIPYTSGPAWLAVHVLRDREVVCIAGTHGKTTTASMTAWILERAGLEPGFLIGGVPPGLGESARPGRGRPFVVEGDEYDTAFFDKRSKFVHYHPDVAVLTNLEFDHADIFDSMEAIRRQFHHLLRTVPRRGWVVVNAADTELARVLEMGCWSRVAGFVDQPPIDGQPSHQPVALRLQNCWHVKLETADASRLTILRDERPVGRVSWNVRGRMNAANALAAIAAAACCGVDPATACRALGDFEPVRRRLEMLAFCDDITMYEDFAHHPTAIRETIATLRAMEGGRIVAVLEPRSNTMRLGVHRDTLVPALSGASRVMILRRSDLAWDPAALVPALRALGCVASLHESTASILDALAEELTAGDRVVFMSNGDFEALPARAASALRARAGARGRPGAGTPGA